MLNSPMLRRLDLTTILDNTRYHSLLSEFPNTTHPTLNPIPVKHPTCYSIITKGPPVFGKPRSLRLEKLKTVKSEFDSLIDQSIIRPSKKLPP
ncbi:hypothetical protein NPIL_540971 [Nephila pilipes]|uniref:Uncharacterized protein n=1 Tax=Nephila pilipes TaxID=299642 RepID=A0A8X6U1F3_NEPPI|nr:hypothetical protein NPIL_540971 [Nephila pilipes]